MGNYNSFQKLLVVFSLTVTAFVVIACLLIVTEPERESVLGASDEILVLDPITINSYEEGLYDTEVNENLIILSGHTSFIHEYFNVEVVSNNFTGYLNSRGIVVLDGTIKVQTKEQPIDIILANNKITVFSNTNALLDAKGISVFVGTGAVTYAENKIIETSEATDFRVDRFYKISGEDYYSNIDSEIKDFGYFMFDNNLLGFGFDLFEPEVVF